MRIRDIKQIHEAGLHILEKIGVLFLDPDTLALLSKRGFSVDGQRVRIAADHVEAAVRSAPTSFALHGRGPHTDLVFGEGLIVAATGGSLFVLEGLDSRAGTEADLVDLVKVMHQSRNLDMLAFAVEPQDVPREKRNLRSLHALLTLSDKPVTFPGYSAELAEAAAGTAEILWGADWHERPRLLFVANSLSPLAFESETCRVIVRMARMGQPVCVTPCVMGGATGPATMAGILALQHAEALAGLVLTQAAREGTPFIYGGTSSVVSMLTGDLLFGVPQYWALMCATVQIAHYLGLPCRAGGGLTDSHLPDMQAGIEATMALAAVARCGVDFVLHGTGTISSVNAVSFEKLIIDDELVGMIRARNLPIEVDEDTLALDTIEAIGPGGNFLLEPHTIAHCRDYTRATFFNRRTHDVWLKRGGWDLPTAARARFRALAESHRAPDLDETTRRQLDKYCLR
ncbi:MAG: trimethylamine methyltransferase family protein [Thermoleophilia bacterium]|nr:trimethylamine methyltransferase family protein [Thermoleophilia bacterium]